MSEQKKKGGFDLKSLETLEDQKATMVPEHPVTYEPLEGPGGPVEIKLAGPDSEIHKKATRAIQARMLKQLGKKRTKDLTPEEVERVNMKTAVACTLDWKNVEWQEETLDPTDENIKMVYENVGWLYDQVNEFINDRANFLGN